MVLLDLDVLAALVSVHILFPFTAKYEYIAKHQARRCR